SGQRLRRWPNACSGGVMRMTFDTFSIAPSLPLTILALTTFFVPDPSVAQAPPFLLSWAACGALATDQTGNVYVANGDTVWKYNNTGGYVSRWAAPGSGDELIGVAVDSNNNVFVADIYNNRIQKFTGLGGYLGQWGSLGSGSGQFNSPWAIGTDSQAYVSVS